MQLNVVPRYKNPPKNPQGKYGNIKTDDGATYWVPRTHLGWFTEGQPAQIVTETQKWGDFQPEVIVEINGHSIKANAIAPNPAPIQPPAQEAQPPAPTQGAVYKTTGAAAPMPADMKQDMQTAEALKAESIFVTGVVQQAAGAGKVDLTTVGQWAQAAVLAWRNRHGAQIATIQRAVKDDPLPNDQIPW